MAGAVAAAAAVVHVEAVVAEHVVAACRVHRQGAVAPLRCLAAERDRAKGQAGHRLLHVPALEWLRDHQRAHVPVLARHGHPQALLEQSNRRPAHARQVLDRVSPQATDQPPDN